MRTVIRQVNEGSDGHSHQGWCCPVVVVVAVAVTVVAVRHRNNSNCSVEVAMASLCLLKD